MDPGLDLSAVPPDERRASVLDVLLLFAGANIVTTTLVTGGSLAPAFSFAQSCLLILAGLVVGTLPLAWLARLGPRFGLPSMVVLRHPFGRGGSAVISALLVATNFAWIALNNVIAAEALTGLAGGSYGIWSLLVGAVAIGVALTGPRAMALFDRIAVPMLVVVGVLLTVRLLGAAGRDALSAPGSGTLGLLVGLDIVVGYQVSWSLMFADYTRFQRREAAATRAVFLGLCLSSAWLMMVGAGAGLAGGGNSPTEMILGLGLPLSALLLMALSTITTNFVNIYLSSLAIRNLWRRSPPRLTVIVVGGIGTLIGLVSPRLLDRYAGFMGWLATLLLPIVAITLVHFFVVARRLADPASAPEWRPRTLVAWGAGVAVYQVLYHTAAPIGATLPTLAVTAASYWLLARQRKLSASPGG